MDVNHMALRLIFVVLAVGFFLTGSLAGNIRPHPGEMSLGKNESATSTVLEFGDDYRGDADALIALERL